MADIQSILTEILQDFNESIIKTLDEKNISNTGQAANSLRVETDESGGRSYGADYLYFLQNGRGPGKFPPVDNIAEWVRQKLGIMDEKENRSITYLVGRKIANEGTKIYINKSEGLELEEKIQTVKDRINSELPKVLAMEIKSDLIKQMRERIGANGN